MISIINLVSGLTYFNLTENEHSVSMNEDLQISTFIKDLFILNFFKLIMLTILFYKKITGSKDNTRLIANIQININSNLLNYCSAMLQDHIN